MKENKKPSRWIYVPLSKICDPNRSKVKPQEYPQLPFIGMDHIAAHKMELIGHDIAKNYKSNSVHFYKDDILYGRLRPYLNKVYKAKFEGLCSAEFIAFPISDFIDQDYLKFVLNSRDFVSFASHLVEGDRPRVNFDIIGNYNLPLPPLPEQHRIVAKIEELFSELDQGIKSLKTAQQQLKIYRQSVLKWAFEGKLTAEWREQQQIEGRLESAETLLEEIKLERENRYQQQIEEWKVKVKVWEENGKEGKKPSKPSKPKIIQTFDKQELLELYSVPNSWYWCKVGQFSLNVEYGTSAKSKKEGKIPVLRMGNIQNSIFDWTDLVYTSDEKEINQYFLRKGDVLFNRTNSPELVGKTAIYQGERPAIFAGYLIRINHFQSYVNSKYLNYFLNSIIAKNYSNKVKTDGVNQSNINGQKLANYPFPYSSIAEQNQIVQEIESRLSICDQLEATIKDNLKKSEALRQSILKQAFEGKLVPQDPNDEPAEKLLERIKKEKAGMKNQVKQLTLETC